ncbi:AAA family ATPase [Caballeronia jiangsuensis]|uniref:AAA family ATPase n=1 Tax=Caballeronia jiangsuensis TaxID=1458357 RepID=A0ABW9CIL5_9BURK
MTTFDQTLPIVSNILDGHRDVLAALTPIVVNRDLNGRIRLIVGEELRDAADATAPLDAITAELAEKLGPHGFPARRADSVGPKADERPYSHRPTTNPGLLFESDIDSLLRGVAHFALPGFDGVHVVDRLATETNWASIAPVTAGAPRIAFFSIKGGVGRSTALASSAWALAQQGKRVLVLDLDLESPGLSSSLLPDDRRPTYGIADWLVEDLVGNGDQVFDSMVATSTLSHDGEIYVVPAHGLDPGEYIGKLGRVWMPKVSANGVKEGWSERLRRLIDALEQQWQPDVILIDSRAGIDEIASACVTDLGANLVLLFAIDGEQTWSGYRILFRHWRTAGVARDIRERLQLVGAMIPEVESADYFKGLCERGWNVFAEELYDDVPAGVAADDLWSFAESDDTAPHYPWPIRWHRGFAALRSLHTRIETVDPQEVTAVFGHLLVELAVLTDADEGLRHDE